MIAIKQMLTIETLRNGAQVKMRRTMPVDSMTVTREIILCYLPWNEFHPYATWQINAGEGDAYWGHYFSTSEQALKDYEARGK